MYTVYCTLYTVYCTLYTRLTFDEREDCYQNQHHQNSCYSESHLIPTLGKQGTYLSSSLPGVRLVGVDSGVGVFVIHVVIVHRVRINCVT